VKYTIVDTGRPMMANAFQPLDRVSHRRMHAISDAHHESHLKVLQREGLIEEVQLDMDSTQAQHIYYQNLGGLKHRERSKKVIIKWAVSNLPLFNEIFQDVIFRVVPECMSDNSLGNWLNKEVLRELMFTHDIWFSYLQQSERSLTQIDIDIVGQLGGLFLDTAK
jgi:hypothetical protein